MNGLGVIEAIVEEKLMALNTGYVAKVLSVSGTNAVVQPLNMVKQYGKAAKAQPPVTAYVLQGARYKLLSKEKEVVTEVDVASERVETEKIAVLEKVPLAAGDIVYCACADRDITEAKRGKMAQPQIGHHSLSDSVVVGVL